MIIEIYHSTGKIIKNIGYHSTVPISACSENTWVDYDVIKYINKTEEASSFLNLTALYTDREGTVHAPNGYYATTDQVRKYHDGAFDDAGYPPTWCSAANESTKVRLISGPAGLPYVPGSTQTAAALTMGLFTDNQYYIDGTTIETSNGIWMDPARSIHADVLDTYYDYKYMYHDTDMLPVSVLNDVHTIAFLEASDSASLTEYTLEYHATAATFFHSNIGFPDLGEGQFYRYLVWDNIALLKSVFEDGSEAIVRGVGSYYHKVTVVYIPNTEYISLAFRPISSAYHQSAQQPAIQIYSVAKKHNSIFAYNHETTLTGNSWGFIGDDNVLTANDDTFSIFAESLIGRDLTLHGTACSQAESISGTLDYAQVYMVDIDGNNTFILDDANIVYRNRHGRLQYEYGDEESIYLSDSNTWRKYYPNAVDDEADGYFHDYTEGDTLDIFNSCAQELNSFLFYASPSSDESTVGLCSNWEDGFNEITAYALTTMSRVSSDSEAIFLLDTLYTEPHGGAPVEFNGNITFGASYSKYVRPYYNFEFVGDIDTPEVSYCLIKPSANSAVLEPVDNIECSICDEIPSSMVNFDGTDLSDSTTIFSDGYNEIIYPDDIIIKRLLVVKSWDASEQTLTLLTDCELKTPFPLTLQFNDEARHLCSSAVVSILVPGSSDSLTGAMSYYLSTDECNPITPNSGSYILASDGSLYLYNQFIGFLPITIENLYVNNPSLTNIPCVLHYNVTNTVRSLDFDLCSTLTSDTPTTQNLYGDTTDISTCSVLYNDEWAGSRADTGYYFYINPVDSFVTAVYWDYTTGIMGDPVTCADRVSININIDSPNYICGTDTYITAWISTDEVDITGASLLYSSEHGSDLIDGEYLDSDANLITMYDMSSTGHVVLHDPVLNRMRLWNYIDGQFQQPYDPDNMDARCITYISSSAYWYNSDVSVLDACENAYFDTGGILVYKLVHSYIDTETQETVEISLYSVNAWGDLMPSGMYSDGINSFSIQQENIRFGVEGYISASTMDSHSNIPCEPLDSINLSRRTDLDDVAHECYLSTLYIADSAIFQGSSEVFYVSGNGTLAGASGIYMDPYSVEPAPAGFYFNSSAEHREHIQDSESLLYTLSETFNCSTYEITSLNLKHTETGESCESAVEYTQHYVGADFTDLSTATHLYSNIYGSSHSPGGSYTDGTYTRNWTSPTTEIPEGIMGDVYLCDSYFAIELTYNSSTSTQFACTSGSESIFYLSTATFTDADTSTPGFMIYKDHLGADEADPGMYSNGINFIEWTYASGIYSVGLQFSTCGALYSYSLAFNESSDVVCLMDYNTDRETYYGDSLFFYDATQLYTLPTGSPDGSNDGIAPSGFYSRLETNDRRYRYFNGTSTETTTIGFDSVDYTACDTMTLINLYYNETVTSDLCPNDVGLLSADYYINGTDLSDAVGTLYGFEDKSDPVISGTFANDSNFSRAVLDGEFSPNTFLEYNCNVLVDISLRFHSYVLPLNIDEVAGTAVFSTCNDGSSSLHVSLQMDTDDFTSAGMLYSDTTNAFSYVNAPYGIYSDGIIWRLWNGSAFIGFNGIASLQYNCSDLYTPVSIHVSSSNVDLCENFNSAEAIEPTTVYIEYNTDADGLPLVGSSSDILGIYNNIFSKDAFPNISTYKYTTFYTYYDTELHDANVHYWYLSYGWQWPYPVTAAEMRDYEVLNSICNTNFPITLDTSGFVSSEFNVSSCDIDNPVDYYINTDDFATATAIYNNTTAGKYSIPGSEFAPAIGNYALFHGDDTGGFVRQLSPSGIFSDTIECILQIPLYLIHSNTGNVCTILDNNISTTPLFVEVGAVTLGDAMYLYNNKWGGTAYAPTSTYLQRYADDGETSIDIRRDWAESTSTFTSNETCTTYSTTITVITADVYEEICSTTGTTEYYINDDAVFTDATELYTSNVGGSIPASIYLYDEAANIIRYFDVGLDTNGVLIGFNNTMLSSIETDANMNACLMYTNSLTLSYASTTAGYACGRYEGKSHDIWALSNETIAGDEISLYIDGTTLSNSSVFSTSQFYIVQPAAGFYSDRIGVETTEGGIDIVTYPETPGVVEIYDDGSTSYITCPTIQDNPLNTIWGGTVTVYGTNQDNIYWAPPGSDALSICSMTADIVHDTIYRIYMGGGPVSLHVEPTGYVFAPLGMYSNSPTNSTYSAVEVFVSTYHTDFPVHIYDSATTTAWHPTSNIECTSFETQTSIWLSFTPANTTHGSYYTCEDTHDNNKVQYYTNSVAATPYLRLLDIITNPGTVHLYQDGYGVDLVTVPGTYGVDTYYSEFDGTTFSAFSDCIVLMATSQSIQKFMITNNNNNVSFYPSSASYFSNNTVKGVIDDYIAASNYDHTWVYDQVYTYDHAALIDSSVDYCLNSVHADQIDDSSFQTADIISEFNAATDIVIVVSSDASTWSPSGTLNVGGEYIQYTSITLNNDAINYDLTVAAGGGSAIHLVGDQVSTTHWLKTPYTLFLGDFTALPDAIYRSEWSYFLIQDGRVQLSEMRYGPEIGDGIRYKDISDISAYSDFGVQLSSLQTVPTLPELPAVNEFYINNSLQSLGLNGFKMINKTVVTIGGHDFTKYVTPSDGLYTNAQVEPMFKQWYNGTWSEAIRYNGSRIGEYATLDGVDVCDVSWNDWPVTSVFHINTEDTHLWKYDTNISPNRWNQHTTTAYYVFVLGTDAADNATYTYTMVRPMSNGNLSFNAWWCGNIPLVWSDPIDDNGSPGDESDDLPVLPCDQDNPYGAGTAIPYKIPVTITQPAAILDYDPYNYGDIADIASTAFKDYTGELYIETITVIGKNPDTFSSTFAKAPDGYYYDEVSRYKEMSSGTLSGTYGTCTYTDSIATVFSASLTPDFLFTEIAPGYLDVFIWTTNADVLGPIPFKYVLSTTVFSQNQFGDVVDLADGYYRDNINYMYVVSGEVQYVSDLGRFRVSLGNHTIDSSVCEATPIYMFIQPANLNSYTPDTNAFYKGDLILAHSTGLTPMQALISDGTSYGVLGRRGAVKVKKSCVDRAAGESASPPSYTPTSEPTNSSGYVLSYSGSTFETSVFAGSRYPGPKPPIGIYSDGIISRYFDGKKLGPIKQFVIGAPINLSHTMVSSKHACKLRHMNNVSKYYIDASATSIASSSGFYTDSGLVRAAPEGYYSDGVQVFKWIPLRTGYGGTLYPGPMCS